MFNEKKVMLQLERTKKGYAMTGTNDFFRDLTSVSLLVVMISALHNRPIEKVCELVNSIALQTGKKRKQNL